MLSVGWALRVWLALEWHSKSWLQQTLGPLLQAGRATNVSFN